MTTVKVELSAGAILALIGIAADLGKVIDDSVNASDDPEIKAAWAQAQGMFNKGYGEAYGSDQSAK